MASSAMKLNGKRYQVHCEMLIASQVNNPIIATIVARHRTEPTVAESTDAAINPHSIVARNSTTSCCVISIGSRPLGSYKRNPTGPALHLAIQAASCSLVIALLI